MRGKEHGRSRKNASGHIITTPEVVAEDGTLQEETDICTACPYTYTDEQCTGCGTYWNMRDLRLDFEAIQQRLIKAATEG